MYSTRTRKTLVQCDFDGTITEEDVSFFLLDKFANGDWRQLLDEYQHGRLSVGSFSARAFAMVRDDRQTLLEAMKSMVKIRAGFPEMIDYFRRNSFHFVIVSNGLDFYINAILRDLGILDVEIYAAQTYFYPEGIKIQYIGPDGMPIDDKFKEAYVHSFLRRGYRTIYIGDGTSDVTPASHCDYIFATGELFTHCRKTNIDCIPFTDFRDIVRSLELM